MDVIGHNQLKGAIETVRDQLDSLSLQTKSPWTNEGFFITKTLAFPVRWESFDKASFGEASFFPSSGVRICADKAAERIFSRYLQVESEEFLSKNWLAKFQEADIDSLIDKISDPEERENIRLIISKLSLEDQIAVDLSKHKIQDSGMQPLAVVFAKMQKLRKLDLSSNEIGDIGLKALLKGLKESPCIEELNLSDNRIKRQGAEALSKFLTTHPTLQILNLSGNKLCSEGAYLLAGAIEKNSYLKSVCLSRCSLGFRALNRLLHALYVNQIKDRGLRELNMENNVSKKDLLGFYKFLAKQVGVLMKVEAWEEADWFIHYIMDEKLRVQTFTNLVEKLMQKGRWSLAKRIILDPYNFPPTERNRLLISLAKSARKSQNLSFMISLLRHLPEEEKEQLLSDFFQVFLDEGNLDRAQAMLRYVKQGSEAWENARLILSAKLVETGNLDEAEYVMSSLPKVSNDGTVGRK